MKVIITDITGIPPFHQYKNARVLLIDTECECGKRDRQTIILEDSETLSIKPMSFEDFVTMIAFYDEPAEWKIRQIQKRVLAENLNKTGQKE